ncbi:substrate-binding domain-containing protein [Microtetraspora malaysiensis]|uniref:substrate-binding domain-containing protein n=1 Tax=Microtetraspora malaysiensis TaxID=161358 RepID=UPI003D936F44
MTRRLFRWAVAAPLALVLAAGDKVQSISFPEAEKAINDYPIAALTKAPAGDLAKKFVDLVLSPQGRDVLTKAGFDAP